MRRACFRSRATGREHPAQYATGCLQPGPVAVGSCSRPRRDRRESRGLRARWTEGPRAAVLVLRGHRSGRRDRERATAGRTLRRMAARRPTRDRWTLEAEAEAAATAVSACSIQAAAAAVRAQQLAINNEIAQLQANIDNLSSAGSIITGIFSAGISYAIEIHRLQDQQQQLRNHEQQQSYEQQCYQNSLGTFNNALNSTKLACYALSTLSTSLQQASNKLSTISTMTNSNMIVMQAELQAFKTEFAQAVTTIGQLIT